MADQVVPAGDPTAVVIYSKRLFSHAIRTCTAAKLMAVGLNAASDQNFVQLFDEPSKGAGDTIKYDLLPNLVGKGTIGDNPIAGTEEASKALQETFIINQLRHAVKPTGRMSQQRVPYSMRDSGKIQLANWWKERLDISLLNQLAGNTAQTDLEYTGLNAAVAPDAAHWIFPGGKTSETGGGAPLTSSEVFSIDLIPRMVAMAQSSLTFPIKPVVIKGVQVDGVLFLHPLQVKALKTNFSAGQWSDIQRAAMTGGQITGNPIFTGALGMIDNVVMHQDAHIPYGNGTQNTVYDSVQGTTIPGPTNIGVASVARAVFCGAQAAAIAFGGADNINGKSLRVKWYEELLDAGNSLRITAGMMFGMKKSRFASQDYATIVCSTWAA